MNKANEILANLGYSESEINELNFLIQCHDDFINISKLVNWKNKKIQ